MIPANGELMSDVLGIAILSTCGLLAGNQAGHLSLYKHIMGNILIRYFFMCSQFIYLTYTRGFGERVNQVMVSLWSLGDHNLVQGERNPTLVVYYSILKIF